VIKIRQVSYYVNGAKRELVRYTMPGMRGRIAGWVIRGKRSGTVYFISRDGRALDTALTHRRAWLRARRHREPKEMICYERTLR